MTTTKLTATEIQNLITDKQRSLEQLQKDQQNLDSAYLFSESQFEEWLDEVYGDIEIAGYTFSTANALKQLDGIAFNQEYLSWVDSQDIEETEEWAELQEGIEAIEDDIEDLEAQLEDLEEDDTEE